MECIFYLVLEKRLFCHKNSKTYEYIDREWINGDWREVQDRLIGYDPFDKTIGNTDVLSEIQELSQEQVVERYGQEVIEKLHSIMQDENDN